MTGSSKDKNHKILQAKTNKDRSVSKLQAQYQQHYQHNNLVSYSNVLTKMKTNLTL
jgi:hypothetical protein